MASAVVLCLVGAGWATYRNALNTSNALDGGEHSTGGAMNILLIGLDSRKDQDGRQLPPQILDKLHAGDGEEGGYNTNTLILIHIPAGGGPATAFSIPRDDLVSIPGEHPDKIKKAYGYAKAKAENALRAQGVTDQHQLEMQSRDAGRRATLDVVRGLTGVPIDHFAEVNLAGFYDIAQALHGVDVCLNHPVHDDYSGADFPAGRQTLDAAQSLAFVRQRHGLPNGDLDRTHRQQAFLSSVAAKLRSAGTFTDPSKLQALYGAVQQDVVIDSGWDVLGFAGEAQNLSGGNLRFQTLPIKGYRTVDGEDVNNIDPQQIRTIVRTAFGYPAPPPAPPTPAAGATVDVLNASSATGLASRVAGTLEGHGFSRGQIANTASRSRSAVQYRPGEQSAAEQVAQLLGGLPTSADSSVPAGHVRVVLGSTFKTSDLPASTTPQSAGAAGPSAPAAAPPAAPPIAPPAPGDGDVPCVD
ncbi:LCP family protein [Saccharopolyspora rosea]|uniref:LCP family protein n=1 Tax=Saccharopolyspora rosea TaxID=524884 RepID=A0ABW3FTL4_9PSEU